MIKPPSAINRTVRTWDVATGKPLLVLSGHTLPPSRIAFLAGGARLVSAASGIIKLWDLKTGSDTLALTVPRTQAFGEVVSPDGTSLVAASDRTLLLLGASPRR